MHDQAVLGVGYGGRDLHDQCDPGAHVEVVRRGVFRDRHAIHEFHRVPGHGLVRHAAVDEARDRRMRQLGQDAPLLHEATLAVVSMEATPQQFERDLLPEAGLFALGQPDLAHAALAERARELERADALSRRRGCRSRLCARGAARPERADRAIQHAALGVGGQHALERGGQLGVGRSPFREARRARRRVELHELVEAGQRP